MNLIRVGDDSRSNELHEHSIGPVLWIGEPSDL